MKPIWGSLLGGVLAGLGLVFPVASGSASGLTVFGIPGLVLVLAAVALATDGRPWLATILVPIGLLGALETVSTLEGPGGLGYWLTFWGFLMVALGALGRVSLSERSDEEGPAMARVRAILPPTSVPLVLLLVWQGLVLGFDVPKGIFPSLGNVIDILVSSYQVLVRDAYVTFVKEVLFGFTFGLAGGFVAGVAIAYSGFLQRGFLPLAAAFGAVPIVGLAPVLGRAFGVDWESKAVVVVIITFFPVVLNTVAGLTEVDQLKLELLRAYGANRWDVFFKLRLPNALPFVFNALKLAAVLSVISVIVAEFLIPGPPVGLGQRISLSARRGAFDVVFAAIFVSSLISILMYGLLSALERWLTGWHPSFREEDA